MALEAAGSLVGALLLPWSTPAVAPWLAGLSTDASPLGVATSHAVALGIAALLARLPLVVYNALAVTSALRTHEAIMKSLACPSIARATCSDPAERPIVLGLLAALAGALGIPSSSATPVFSPPEFTPCVSAVSVGWAEDALATSMHARHASRRLPVR